MGKVRAWVEGGRHYDTVVCREMCRAAGVRFRPRHAKAAKVRRRGPDRYEGWREGFGQRYGVRL